jgi:S1-C subfamily serine protease
MSVFKLFCNVLILFLCLPFAVSACQSKDTTSLNFYAGSAETTDETTKELDQKKLFNMVRRGVVAITVNAHVILEKYFNDKMWHGTGFIVDLDKGLIVTNAHIAGELAVCTYEVKFGNGRTAEAKLEYIDPCYDFAILSVNKKDIPQYSIALKLSDKPITLNTAVYSMGNSSKNEFSIYNGFVFDTESIVWLKPLAEQSFQFSGLTVPGASGSPVFNIDGDVIGLLYGGKFVSGAALPISYIKPAIEALKECKQFRRYFFGCIVNYTSMQNAIDAGSLPESAVEEYEKHFPDSNNKILYVKKTLSAFNIDTSPLKAGDIIWQVDGEFIGPELKLIDKILHKKDGKPIQMTVYRDGVKKDLQVPIEELSIKKKLKLLSFAGATFFELTDELKITSGQTSNGVFLMDSEAGSPFMEVTSSTTENSYGGIFQITEIDNNRLANLDDLIAILPGLFKKKVFQVKYIKVGGDSQENSVITKYSPEFADAVLHTFNHEKKQWDVTSIKNPAQK